MLRRVFIGLLAAVIAAGGAAQSKVAAESRPAPDSQPASADASDFAPLFRFCPAQIESVMCVTGSTLPEGLQDLGTIGGGVFQNDAEIKCPRVMYAGRKFKPRMDYEGVVVYELENRLLSLSNALDQDAYNYETIDGAPCFVREANPDGYGPLENWVTLAEQKFLIFATRRAILREVLAGRGPTPESCIERLGWKAADVDWSAAVVIARKYDAANKEDPHSPLNAKSNTWPRPRGFPIERILMTYQPGKRKGRLDFVSRDPGSTLKYFRSLLGDNRAESRPADEEDSPFNLVELVGSTGERHTLSISEAGERDWLISMRTFMIYGLAQTF